MSSLLFVVWQHHGRIVPIPLVGYPAPYLTHFCSSFAGKGTSDAGKYAKDAGKTKKLPVLLLAHDKIKGNGGKN
ncbi:hypothetical protein [Ammoniphilus sp. YIM 78166]|uniref:hypothetical protein n=1 Tax=Ammoniphilus sp. YIM 78166 TaxID=1644106 RepID=UPI001431F663|nr:hypothetical protein [Ammoniphilus sp. YIM 78166]